MKPFLKNGTLSPEGEYSAGIVLLVALVVSDLVALLGSRPPSYLWVISAAWLLFSTWLIRHGQLRLRIEEGRSAEHKSTLERLGFSFTRRARWGLAVVAALWLSYLFEPGIVWLISFSARSNPVRNGGIQATIPRTWRVANLGSDIVAFRQVCATRLCTSAQPSGTTVGLRLEPRMRELIDVMLRASSQNMENDGYSRQTSRSMQGLGGTIRCVEAFKRGSPNQARGFCYALEGDLHANFEGDSSDLDVFHEIVKSVQRL